MLRVNWSMRHCHTAKKIHGWVNVLRPAAQLLFGNWITRTHVVDGISRRSVLLHQVNAPTCVYKDAPGWHNEGVLGACRTNGQLVVVSYSGSFYPNDATSAGMYLDLGRSRRLAQKLDRQEQLEAVVDWCMQIWSNKCPVTEQLQNGTMQNRKQAHLEENQLPIQLKIAPLCRSNHRFSTLGGEKLLCLRKKAIKSIYIRFTYSLTCFVSSFRSCITKNRSTQSALGGSEEGSLPRACSALIPWAIKSTLSTRGIVRNL